MAQVAKPLVQWNSCSNDHNQSGVFDDWTASTSGWIDSFDYRTTSIDRQNGVSGNRNGGSSDWIAMW